VTPFITVAICTWNRSHNLRVTLEHFTKLRVPAGVEWELLVVNNNCTDDTDAVCRQFEALLPIRVLHESTAGQSYARNLAIREARGTYIAWTDDDVVVDQSWLEALMKAFTRYDATWVFGSSEPEWPSTPPAWYSPRFRGYFAVLDYGSDPFVVKDFLHPFYGLNFAGTREAHRQLNGFRTEFGFRGNEGGVGEDVDMFERAMRAGMRIVYTPDAHVRHIIPPSRLEKQYHRRRQWIANRVYYRHLDEIFPDVPWLMGLPRFFYPNAVRDAVGYFRCAVTRDRHERFHHELQLLRFVKVWGEAARSGFRKRPAILQSAVSPSEPTGMIQP
jgi:glycosyltransferase involved in cell wall biosynthesis